MVGGGYRIERNKGEKNGTTVIAQSIKYIFLKVDGTRNNYTERKRR